MPARLNQAGSTLTLAGAVIYVADDFGDVRALDANTGRQHWRFRPPRAAGEPEILIIDPPVDGKDLIFVGLHRGTTAGEVVALTADGGLPRWSRAVPAPVLGLALDTATLAYTTSSSLNVLDASTGQDRWGLRLGSPRNVTFRGELLVTTYRQGSRRPDRMTAYRVSDGHEVWSRDLPWPAPVGLLGTRELMLAAASPNPEHAHGLRLGRHIIATGKTVWSRVFGREGARLVSTTATQALVMDDRGVHALRTDTGKTMWTFRQPPGSYPAAWTAGDLVILAMTVPDEDGLYEVFGLDAESGGKRWENGWADDFQEAVLGEGVMYVTMTGGRDRVMALDTVAGNKLWETGVPVGSSLVLGQNLLYVCAPAGEPGGGAVYALEPGSGEQVRR